MGPQLDRIAASIKDGKEFIDDGLKLAAKMSKYKDGELGDFFKSLSDKERKALLYCCKNEEFARLANKVDTHDILAAAAGSALGKLQPHKLGVLAAQLCNATYTSDRDERALIAIAMDLKDSGFHDSDLSAFENGLKAAGCNYDKFLHYINDYSGGVEKRVALAHLYLNDISSSRRELAEGYLNQAMQPLVKQHGKRAWEVMKLELAMVTQVPAIMPMLSMAGALEDRGPMQLKDMQANFGAVVLRKAKSDDKLDTITYGNALSRLDKTSDRERRDVTLLMLAAYYQRYPELRDAIRLSLERMSEQDRARFNDILNGNLTEKERAMFDKMRESADLTKVADMV